MKSIQKWPETWTLIFHDQTYIDHEANTCVCMRACVRVCMRVYVNGRACVLACVFVCDIIQ